MSLSRRAARGAEAIAHVASTPFRGLRWEVRPPTRWPIALRASIAMAIPLSLATALGHQPWGLLTGTGAFTVLYGAGRPLRSRSRVLVLVGIGLVASMALGTLTAGNLWLAILVTAAVGATATFLAHALRLGPPGAFFFVLVVGIGGYLPSRGLDPGPMIAATAVGAAIAIPIALFDLLIDRRGPERAAVREAERAVDAFLDTPAGDPERESRSTEATNALHDAWTTLWDAGDPVDDTGVRSDLMTELIVQQHRYAGALLPGVESNPDLAGESMAARLGRPALRHLIRRGARWPTTALQSALRVAAGIAAAGLVAGLLLSTSHMYWAMAAAALVLHTGIDRRSTSRRSVERLAGTALGIVLFLLGGFSDSGPWALVLVIVVLQGLVELCVVRNYTLAVVFMTPLALTIGTAGSGLPALTVAQERLIDTAIGVVCGAAVPWFVGWRSGRRMVTAHLSRVLASSADVAALLSEGRHDDDAGLRAQRELSLDLAELSAVAGRAIRDEPERVGELVPVREATAWLGFTVLATASQLEEAVPLARVGAAVEPARQLSSELAHGRVPEGAQVRRVRELVGARPPLG